MQNIHIKIVLLLLFTISVVGAASISNMRFSLKDMRYGDAVVTKVTSIYDGDTFRANLDGFPDLIGHRIGIRVAGVDTPEIKGKCKKEKLLARKAKQFAVIMLRSGNQIKLKNLKRGKYFRIVADVYIDGVSLADELIRVGLGVVYNGGKKNKDWCK